MEDLPQELQPRGSNLELTVLMIIERLQALEEIVHRATEMMSRRAVAWYDLYDPRDPLRHLAQAADAEIGSLALKARYGEKEHLFDNIERAPDGFHRLAVKNPGRSLFEAGRRSGATFFWRRWDLLRVQLSYQSFYSTDRGMPMEMPAWLYVSWNTESAPKTEATAVSTWERVE